MNYEHEHNCNGSCRLVEPTVKKSKGDEGDNIHEIETTNAFDVPVWGLGFVALHVEGVFAHFPLTCGVLNHTALGASDRADTISGQPSPFKSPTAIP